MVPSMQIAAIKELAERTPFRPFAVRLNNGTEYVFREPREFGAPRDCHMIFYFGQSNAVRIDTDSISEVIEQ